MIISKKWANTLQARGQAKDEGRCYQPDTRQTYGVLSRTDIHRTDHYLVGAGDLRRDALDDAA